MREPYITESFTPLELALADLRALNFSDLSVVSPDNVLLIDEADVLAGITTLEVLSALSGKA